MSDAETTIQDLRDEVNRFNDDRDWHPFHTPKNVVASIVIEAAELLENFQWTDQAPSGQSSQLVEELADVVIYCLTLSNTLGIDLSQAIRQKLARNEVKYPVERHRGQFQ